MRFSDFFVSYKIMSSEPSKDSSEKKKELKYLQDNKGIVVLLLLFIVIVEAMLIYATAFGIVLYIVSMSLVLGCFFYRREHNIQELKKRQKPERMQSSERMKSLIELLNEYNIDINNIQKIDYLINEAEIARQKYDYFFQLEKLIKPMNAVRTCGLTFISNIFSAKQEGTINQLLMIGIIWSGGMVWINLVAWLIKDTFFLNYKKCNELIVDLRQVKLFYSK